MKKEEIELKITREEHQLITAILMMHHTGFIIPVKNEMIHKVAKDWMLRDIRLDVKSKKI